MINTKFLRLPWVANRKLCVFHHDKHACSFSMHQIHISPYTRSFLYAGQTFHFEQSRLDHMSDQQWKVIYIFAVYIKPRFTHIGRKPSFLLLCVSFTSLGNMTVNHSVIALRRYTYHWIIYHINFPDSSSPTKLVDSVWIYNIPLLMI